MKEKHSCKTYLAVRFEFDAQKNAEFVRAKKFPAPEDIGITNKTEVERKLTSLGVEYAWKRHGFIVGLNSEYEVDINAMLRKTLSGLLGKEAELKRICRDYGVSLALVAVPQIAAESDEPKPYLSLADDIIAFLYKSGATTDLDYYIV